MKQVKSGGKPKTNNIWTCLDTPLQQPNVQEEEHLSPATFGAPNPKHEEGM